MAQEVINRMKKSKFFLIMTICCVALFIIVQIFAGNKSPNSTQNLNQNYISSNTNRVDLNSPVYIENYLKVWEFLYTFKDKKTVAYELRRKLEKQDLFTLVSNKDVLKEIFKSIKYTQDQEEKIKQLFGDKEVFLKYATDFYVYLVVSQLDEQRINEIRKQIDFFKKKIYKVDPETIQKIKDKKDPDLDKILHEVEENLYQPNLSEQKKQMLLAQIQKMNYILLLYEEFRKDKIFNWFVENRKRIIDSLSFKGK